MKTKWCVGILFAVVSVGMSSSYAGDKEGNGGGVHFCDAKTEMYDLYEARKAHGLTLDYSCGKDEECYIRRAIDKLSPRYPRLAVMLLEEIQYIRANALFQDEVELAPIRDANILVHDEGCLYRQLANWWDISGKIIVDNDYFKLLDAQSRAAFYVHEAIYKIYRYMGEEKSDKARRLTGQIFSTSNMLSVMREIPLWGTAKTERKYEAFHYFVNPAFMDISSSTPLLMARIKFREGLKSSCRLLWNRGTEEALAVGSESSVTAPLLESYRYLEAEGNSRWANSALFVGECGNWEDFKGAVLKVTIRDGSLPEQIFRSFEIPLEMALEGKGLKLFLQVSELGGRSYLNQAP